MTTIQRTITLDSLSCGVCNISFALERNHLTHLQDTGVRFYCPNGHKISYSDTEIDRLRKERDQLVRQRDGARSRATHLSDQLEAEKRSKAAVKGHLTRTRRMIANGICPAPGCRRHFANVTAHMERQHPDYVEELDARKRSVNERSLP